jgi:hypothetical protein
MCGHYTLYYKKLVIIIITKSEKVKEFKYLGTTLTNQNSIAEEIKSRLGSGKDCYHSVQNLFLPGCYPKI